MCWEHKAAQLCSPLTPDKPEVAEKQEDLSRLRTLIRKSTDRRHVRCQDTETTGGYESSDIRDTPVVSKFPLRSRVLPSKAELPLRQLSAWLAYSFDNALNVKVSGREYCQSVDFS